MWSSCNTFVTKTILNSEPFPPIRETFSGTAPGRTTFGCRIKQPIEKKPRVNDKNRRISENIERIRKRSGSVPSEAPNGEPPLKKKKTIGEEEEIRDDEDEEGSGGNVAANPMSTNRR